MLIYDTSNYKYIDNIKQIKNFRVNRITVRIYKSPKGAILAKAYVSKYPPKYIGHGKFNINAVHVKSLYIGIGCNDPRVYYENSASRKGFYVDYKDEFSIDIMFNEVIERFERGEFNG